MTTISPAPRCATGPDSGAGGRSPPGRSGGSARLEEQVDPPPEQHGQGEVDQEQVAAEQALARDHRDQVHEMAERGLAPQGGQQADPMITYQTHQ